MITKINNVEFETSEAIPYTQNTDLSLMIYVYANSIYEVVNAAGEVADIEVGDIFSGSGYKLESARLFSIGKRMGVESKFVPASLLNMVNANTEDIETLSEAVIELAEIIGGDE